MSMTKAVSSICLNMLKVDGHATAATVTGLKAEDTLIMVLHFTDDTGDKLTADITASCTAGDGTMACPDTSNDTLLVFWHSADGSSGTTYSKLCLKCFEADGAASELTVTGITANDEIIGALHFTSGVFTDQIANAYCTPGAGIVTIDTYGTTADDKVLFFWISVDEDQGSPIGSPCIRCAKVATVAAPATAIAVTGMEMGDTILHVGYYDDSGVWQSDDTANCSVSESADGYMYSTTTFSATNKSLVVLFHDASA